MNPKITCQAMLSTKDVEVEQNLNIYFSLEVDLLTLLKMITMKNQLYIKSLIITLVPLAQA